MRKLLPLLVVGIFVLSGLGAIAGTESEIENFGSETIIFSQPIIREKNDYVVIELSEATSDSWESEKPMLPIVTKVFTFPFGTRVDSVDVTFSDAVEKGVTKQIQPAPEPIMKTIQYNSNALEMSKTVSYSDIDVYPEQRYSYRTGGGLKGEEHVTYLTVSVYPVQYYPNKNIVSYSDKATIEISYTPPTNPMSFGDAYDLLIITPAEFESALQPLADHKDGIGIATKLTTLDEIPSGVGLDDQEDIKYYIKDAIENWGITYLLLVGAGVKDAELFPVRYAWIPSSPYEDNFASDLYYADIYDSVGGFSSWDHDGDGKHGEYPQDVPACDVIPDVYLGKLPANTASEVTNVVNKIINYKEHNGMTNQILQIGGDTFPGDGGGIYEGEYANDEVLSKLPTYSSTKLWASNGKLTKANIAKGYRKGVDFVDFSGHGSAQTWATHPCDDDSIWIPPKALISPYTGWLWVDFDLFLVLNSKKLPVVFYNACSTNKYTSTDMTLAWKTLVKKNGGGIAAFGATGIGYGSHGTDETKRLFGWMEVHTFEEIYDVKVLGDAWGNCVTNYYNTFSSNLNDGDYKTLFEYAMFADPTLAIEDGDDPVNIPVYRPHFNIFERIIERFPLLAKLLGEIFA